MEDQPADSGDLTTGESEKPRRRLRFGRRRESVPAQIESETSTEVQTASERPTPTGKAGRKAMSAKAESEVEPASVGEPQSSDEDAETPEADVEPESPEPEAEPDEERVLAPHRPAGKRLVVAVAVAAAVFVAAGAFGGAMVQPYVADRALVATKLQVARTATDAITTLWTYNPDNIESLPDRAARYLTGDFAQQYRQLIDSLAAGNKQAQVTNNTEVMGTAVETIGRDEATAIVYTNTVSTSPVTKNVPSLRYLSFRLTLQRDGEGWRITQMPALTQLDLSPQF